MNNVSLVGRVTKKPELRVSQNGKNVCRFTLAVYRTKEETDFINCVAFDKGAEYIDRYVEKGNMLEIEGNIKTGSYDKQDGTKVYTTDVYVVRQRNITPKNDTNNNVENNTNVGVEDITTDDLPF